MTHVPAHAYIVAMGKCLPNAPVGNDAMEDILGRVGQRPSRARRITLRNSGITSRHYAIDPASGLPTHSNAQLAALAVRDALGRAGWQVGHLDLLTCGTSSPDQLKPAHAPMVHGELGEAALEAVSLAGVCCSGMAALKHAELAIRAGDCRRAACTGSELASSFMAARNFPCESEATVDAAEHVPLLAFEKDFLRWMLSDGAGAALLAGEPQPGRMALRIDWIDGVSLAHREPVCMYSGAVKLADGRLQGWRNAPSPEAMLRDHYLAVKQDARLLEARIPELMGPDTLLPIARRRGLDPAQIDWLLPHYSSHYFRGMLRERLAELGIDIPEARWFTNLSQVGNVGAASIFLMLEELLNTGRLARGQKILCFVPESSRFSVYYMQLTVV